MAKRPKLTMAQAEMVAHQHPDWKTMTPAERRQMVEDVNTALKSEAQAERYIARFKPKKQRKK